MSIATVSIGDSTKASWANSVKTDHETLSATVSSLSSTVSSLLASRDSGYINTNDWTNRHLGSVNIAYDGLSGTFEVGEIVTEEISGNTGIVMSDSGTILVLRDITGTGIFTNNREITGADSGATADVDGDTKNVDSNFYHGFNKPLSDLLVKVLVSTDGTDANSFEVGTIATKEDSVFEQGFTIFVVDNNNVQVQTGSGGIGWIDQAAGGRGMIAAQNWYYKIKTYLMG